MECIVLEGYLDMISSRYLSVKISEELDLFDTPFQIIVIQKSLKNMQQVVVFDLRVGYQ